MNCETEKIGDFEKYGEAMSNFKMMVTLQGCINAR